jgi:hypothetical protein
LDNNILPKKIAPPEEVRVHTAGNLFPVLRIHSFYRTTQWKDSETMKSNVKELIKNRKELNEANNNTNEPKTNINQGQHNGTGKQEGGLL